MSVCIIVLSCVKASGFTPYIVGFTAIFLFSEIFETYSRYKKIRTLSDDLGSILNDLYSVDIESYDEGELAVLSNEISKLIGNLKMNAEILGNDKKYLANSIADISHQIRTPLTSINLIIEFLSEPGLSDEQIFEYVSELKSLLNRIDWLISTLLKISKLDTGMAAFAKAEVSVKELIDKSYSFVAIPMELKNQSIEINISDERYIGDINWSCEAVTNILKNCMEHTQENGKITISSNETALYTEIIISDNGKGISEDDLPNIFKRFYKGKNSGNSSFGIGLALAKMIIEQQNGVITAKNNSDEESGAVFLIRFYKGIV